MKKLILLLVLGLFLQKCYSQEENYYNDYLNPKTNSVPNYLQSWWGQTKIGYVAIVYLDFPDGRYNDGGVWKQPYTNRQLSWVNHPDASGEAGVIKTNGVYSLQALKYDWYDRWNMWYDTLGVYNGTAHPDFLSHGDSAYGSMREYWKDASGNHFLMEPYETHPGNSNYKIRYGIINDFDSVGGRLVIKNFMMPLNKYGNSDDSSYFRSFNDNVDIVTKGVRLMRDANTYVRQYYANSFDWQDFDSKGGIIIFVMSGSQMWFKGLGMGNCTIVRGRFNEITDMSNSRIDGISITAHEYAHLAFGWQHTSASRYCLMNAYDRHNKDCPQLPNPVLRMREGWITPIEIRGSQSITDLPPIETSKQCGVITVYGKPSAKPDWTCGESFIVENRKQIGFDRKILEKNNPDRKPGGLLVWHYSPYSNFQPAFPDVGWDLSYEFVPANNDLGVYGSYGNPDHFYGLVPSPNGYHILNSNRTVSSLNLNSGIVIDSIEQNNYADLYSTIRFKLIYTIAEPPNYTYVIQGLENPSTIVNLHDTVYYHNPQDRTGFILSPGTVVETRPLDQISLNGVKARGSQNSNIIFNTFGYANYRPDYAGVSFMPNSLMDTTILNFCKFLKKQSELRISISANDISKPLFCNDNLVEGESSQIDLISDYSEMSGMNVSSFKNNDYKKLNLFGYFRISMDDDFTIQNGATMNIESKNNNNVTVLDYTYPHTTIINGIANINTTTKTNKNLEVGSTGSLNIRSLETESPQIFFAPNTGINCSGSLTISPKCNSNIEMLVNSTADTSYWNGIQCSNPGNVEINKTTIKKAKTGYSITNNVNTTNIHYSHFQNNLFADIKLDNSITSDAAKVIIDHNTFTGNSDLISSIVSDEILNVTISDNVFNDIYSNGVSLMYTTNPMLLNNQFFGTTQYSGGAYTGIYSYYSGGFYNCNSSTNFYDGILLDNSSPYLLNNEIWNNGYGLYLTNNSIPIMSPSYSQTQALYNAGYNKIYNNASDEIYCDNTENYQLSYPYLYKGFNSIYDSTNSGYLVNLNYYFDPPLDATDNFWGWDYNYLTDKFNPQGSLTYVPYLDEPGFISYCSSTIQTGDFSNLQSEALLLGSANIDAYNKNYSSAETKYIQLLNQLNRPYKTQNVLSRLFNNLLISRGNFNSAVTFFETFAQQHPADTFVCRKSHNLSIGSKVEQPNYPEAISDYNQLSITSNYQKEKYYATIDKMRTIRLMLDTLMNNYGNGMGGDHSGLGNGMGGDHFQLGNGLINELENNKSAIINYLDGISRFSKTRGLISRTDSKFNVLNSANSINVNNMTKKEKIELISNIVISSLVKNNALINIPLKRPINRISSRFHKQSIKQESIIPKKYELSQNYPNPFNPSTTIKYAIPKNGVVQIKLYDITGREVKSLVNELKTAGYYSITFNASDLSSGVYFYRIQTNDFVQTKRMVLVK